MKHAVAALFLLAIVPASAQQPPASAPRDCPVCPELALVPPGQFQMGSAPDAPELEAGRGESPAARLSFARPVMVSAREITHGAYRRFVCRRLCNGLVGGIGCPGAGGG